MRWKGRRGSSNVEDRRGQRTRGPVFAGGGVLGIAIIIIYLLMGGDPQQLMQQQANNPQAPGAGANQIDPEEDRLAQFVSVVLADTEEVWADLFSQMGSNYRDPKLVLFRERVQSACGFQQAATGPFYCPADQQVYIDLSFYEEMERRLNAPGDFAQAYVIAHEVGHHVQNLLGISNRVHRLQQQAGEEQANELSVRLELQADFLAGVWAHHAQQNWQILEEGDIEEALTAASAIGDDRLQMQGRGYVVPESFTHGTSEQRTRWFLKGLKSGDIKAGDTFELDYDEL
ncbi:Putative neutral zinc metallopeptidase [Polystyrenella longa]|uniref:Neutral zinc metallopeptidase n=1 Tax=Polystyrenella longa TaxID=2528007 RepID=A0A518CKH8_9PLAN|nr:neutral zinc metallopeptidase [Polystyrenella longa]QDU79735.1 Putative neutral zinc metallopeptidase [Polystyrenella longa]